GGWHLFAASVTAAGAVSFYRDGLSVGQASGAAPNAYGGPYALGARSDGGAGFLAGRLAFAAVWSRALGVLEHAARPVGPGQLFAAARRAWWLLHAPPPPPPPPPPPSEVRRGRWFPGLRRPVRRG